MEAIQQKVEKMTKKVGTYIKGGRKPLKVLMISPSIFDYHKW